MKMTKRELFLVFILGFVSIVGLMFFFLIQPLQMKLDGNTVTLEALEAQKTMIESNAVTNGEKAKQVETRTIEVGALLNQFATPMNEAQFDQWVLPILQKYNSKLIDAQFDEPMVVQPAALELLYSKPVYDVKTWVDEIHGIEPIFTDQPVSTNMLLMSVHMYKFRGTYENYRAVMNEISAWNTTIYVGNSVYDFTTSEAVITFNVYMVDKLVPEANPHVYVSQ